MKVDRTTEILALTEQMADKLAFNSSDRARVEAGYWRGLVTGLLLSATPDFNKAARQLARIADAAESEADKAQIMGEQHG